VRRPFLRASLVAFISSFCTLVIELVAGRILAPYVGVSLYTWTSIIGIVLAGISAGAYAGGWLADRRPHESTLGWLLLAAGIAALLIGPATDALAANDGILTTLGIATTLLARVVVLSALLFFLPAFLLGMISPVAVKLAVRDLDTAGSVVGKISAFSTLGAIAGTFVTGFWLVARFGTRATVLGVGVTLIATALILGGLLPRRASAIAAGLVASIVIAFALRTTPLAPPHQEQLLETMELGTLHVEESQYYTIRVERTVRDDNGAPINELQLDHLSHSYTDLSDAAYLEYGYLRIFRDLAEQRAQNGAPMRVLFIGGGGYTLPRLLERTQPATDIDVVELDPAVTRVAQRYFGIPRDTRIRTFNEDARWFAMRGPAESDEEYDLVFIDAFNDLSVPYHLTTREFTESLRRLLKPDGVLAVNLIDHYEEGRFLASYARTLQSLFGIHGVSVVLEAPEDLESVRSTFVVLASRALPQLRNWTAIDGFELDAYVKRRNGIVLTDDYVPVDNMLAPLFRDRFADEVGSQ
jgi:predicted membrane-bound spermidine synthase